VEEFFPFPEVASPEILIDEIIERDAAAMVAELVASLPERQRVAIKLEYYDGLSRSQVGAAMAISTEAVGRLHARAMDNLWLALLARSIKRTSDIL